MKSSVPYILFFIYVAVFTALAVLPYDRAVWWAENIPIILIVLGLICIHKYYVFSPLSYCLMFVLIIMHTIGGHFTFERVPFDLVNNLFGFARNNYDRFAHFSVGLYAFPMGEVLLKKKLICSRTVLFLFPIFTIFTVASGYEIIEWLYALFAEESSGVAVLGSQGDMWDAQKDMLMDGLGSVFAMLLFGFRYRKDIRTL